MSSNDIAIWCPRWHSGIEAERKTFLEHNITIVPKSKFSELEGLEEMVLKWFMSGNPHWASQASGLP
jgi:hypothetical protein